MTKLDPEELRKNQNAAIKSAKTLLLGGDLEQASGLINKEMAVEGRSNIGDAIERISAWMEICNDMQINLHHTALIAAALDLLIKENYNMVELSNLCKTEHFAPRR